MAAFSHNGEPGSALDRELRGLNCRGCDWRSARITELERELAAAQEALRKQGQAALQGMNAAKAIATHNLKSAEALNAQSNPAALDDARALNERLTNELEAAQEEAKREKMAKEYWEGSYKRDLAAAQEARQRAEALAESNARDAERYRWLRGNGAIISRAVGIPVHLANFGIGLDAAIDAARKP